MTGAAVQWVGEFLHLADPCRRPLRWPPPFQMPMASTLFRRWSAWARLIGTLHARGTITGLGRSHTAAHLARAAVDAIAFQVADVFFAMEKAAGAALSRFCSPTAAQRATAHSCNCRQTFLAGRCIADERGTLGLGAAWLAGLALGWWSEPGRD